MEPMSFPRCSSCGFSHPPPTGDRCPMLKDKTPSGIEINFESLFTPLKNILTSQIKKKDIKDMKKLFGKIILEVTKITEGYEEKS